MKFIFGLAGASLAMLPLLIAQSGSGNLVWVWFEPSIGRRGQPMVQTGSSL